MLNSVEYNHNNNNNDNGINHISGRMFVSGEKVRFNFNN